MAITHVGSETATDNGTSTTLTVTKPAGAAENDVAIAVICADDNDGVTLPTGFTTINNTAINVDDAEWAVGYKVLGGSEPSTYDFTKDFPEIAVASISVFRGVDTASPLDATSTTNTGDSTTPTATGLTTVTDGAAVIAVAAAESGGASPFTPPSGMAEIVDVGVGTSPSDGAASVAWVEQATAGATGNKQFTASDDDTWGATLLALSPGEVEHFADLALASETDTARAMTLDRAFDLALAQETESAFAVAASRSFELALAQETNSAFNMTFPQALDLALAQETGTAFAVSVDRAIGLSLAQETDTAFGVTIDVTLVANLGLAQETDTAFAVTLDRAIDLGLAQETDTAFAVTLGVGKVALLALAQETESAFNMSFPKTIPIGLAQEVNSAFDIRGGRALDLALAQETDTAFGVFTDAVITAQLDLARETDTAFRLDSGLPPFTSRLHDVVTPGHLPSRIESRPLILTDRTTGTTYVIRMGGGMLLELFPAEKEFPRDEVFAAFHEPTMEVADQIFRIFVAGGELKFEAYGFHIRKRPILFGRTVRPRTRDPRWVLLLREDVLSEAETNE